MSLDTAMQQMPWMVRFLNEYRHIIMPVLMILCVIAIIPIAKSIFDGARKDIRYLRSIKRQA
jgi:hypothetical protein